MIRAYSNKIDRLSREGWEQTRMIMYSTLLPHQKKHSKLSLTDVMPLPWDNDTPLPESIPIEEQKEKIEAQRLKWAEIDKRRAEKK